MHAKKRTHMNRHVAYTFIHISTQLIQYTLRHGHFLTLAAQEEQQMMCQQGKNAVSIVLSKHTMHVMLLESLLGAGAGAGTGVGGAEAAG